MKDQKQNMLFRFCLYGFLKNQTYFEPFLILALRQKGLSFFHIGLLVGFRHLCMSWVEQSTLMVSGRWPSSAC